MFSEDRLYGLCHCALRGDLHNAGHLVGKTHLKQLLLVFLKHIEMLCSGEEGVRRGGGGEVR